MVDSDAYRDVSLPGFYSDLRRINVEGGHQVAVLSIRVLHKKSPAGIIHSEKETVPTILGVISRVLGNTDHLGWNLSGYKAKHKGFIGHFDTLMTVFRLIYETLFRTLQMTRLQQPIQKTSYISSHAQMVI